MARSRSEIISSLESPGIIAIVRTQKSTLIRPVFEALVSAGIVAIEITMTTPNALEIIREASEAFGSACVIGVGTVLDTATCQQAIDAGAEFVVTPVCRTELVPIVHAARRPIMLGAYTPTEAQRAHEADADFVKLFPADTLGPAYIKAIRAPLPHLRIVPTGGVSIENVGDFFRAGCVAVGVGSSLVSADILQNRNWSELSNRAAMFVKAAKVENKK